MKEFLFTVYFFSCTCVAFGQDKPAYVLYNSSGKKVSFSNLVRDASKSDLVLFGELHNNAIAHWLQLELTNSLGDNNELILGAEMFERDNQVALDAYLSGATDVDGLDSTVRLWTNYATDYAPLVDYAKTHNRPFIATNIPRSFANRVYKNGGFTALDSLTELEKKWIAPLPIPYDSLLPTYVHILEMMGDHGTPELVKAQAIKDATMAYSIVENIKDGSIFIHFNGAFHSNFYEGILWYVNQYKDAVDTVTISTVTQADIQKLEKEHHGKADYIICVDEDVTTTY